MMAYLVVNTIFFLFFEQEINMSVFYFFLFPKSLVIPIISPKFIVSFFFNYSSHFSLLPLTKSVYSVELELTTLVNASTILLILCKFTLVIVIQSDIYPQTLSH